MKRHNRPNGRTDRQTERGDHHHHQGWNLSFNKPKITKTQTLLFTSSSVSDRLQMTGAKRGVSKRRVEQDEESKLFLQ